MRLPVKDIFTNNDIYITTEPFLTLLLFSLKTLKFLSQFSQEFDHECIGVYIGKQVKLLQNWVKNHKKICRIVSGEHIDNWTQFKVKEKPWVLVFHNFDMLLSISALVLELPLRKNIMRRLGTSQNEDFDIEKIQKNMTVEIKTHTKQQNSVINNSNPYENDWKLVQLAKIAENNLINIEKLKSEVQRKNVIIKEINGKIEALKIKKPKNDVLHSYLLRPEIKQENYEFWNFRDRRYQTPIPFSDVGITAKSKNKSETHAEKYFKKKRLERIRLIT